LYVTLKKYWNLLTLKYENIERNTKYCWMVT